VVRGQPEVGDEEVCVAGAGAGGGVGVGIAANEADADMHVEFVSGNNCFRRRRARIKHEFPHVPAAEP